MPAALWTCPDAEQLLIDYLEPLLGVPVGSEVADAPAFVQVVRTGGVKPTPVSDRPRLTFDVYAGRYSTAWALLERTREAVHGIAGTTVAGTSVKEVVEDGGPALLPDPDFPALIRYRFTLSVHLRAATP
jgi:hypothetical protein